MFPLEPVPSNVVGSPTGTWWWPTARATGGGTAGGGGVGERPAAGAARAVLGADPAPPEGTTGAGDGAGVVGRDATRGRPPPGGQNGGPPKPGWKTPPPPTGEKAGGQDGGGGGGAPPPPRGLWNRPRRSSPPRRSGRGGRPSARTR